MSDSTMPKPFQSPAPFRYLLVDIDGTLLTSRGELTPRTSAALHRAVAGGMNLVLATGRTHASLTRITRSLDLPPYSRITNGGAVGISLNGQEVRYIRCFEPGAWNPVVSALLDEGLSPLVFSHRHPEPPLFYVTDLSGSAHFEAYVRRNAHLCRVTPLRSGQNLSNVVEVAALGDGEAFDDATARVLQRLSGSFEGHSMVLTLNGRFGKITEFFPLGTSKWSAFLGLFPEAVEHPDQVAAIGDEANDVEMITEAGLGIAMGNATAEVKAIADRITGHNDRDGLAEAIEELLA